MEKKEKAKQHLVTIPADVDKWLREMADRDRETVAYAIRRIVVAAYNGATCSTT